MAYCLIDPQFLHNFGEKNRAVINNFFRHFCGNNKIYKKF